MHFSDVFLAGRNKVALAPGHSLMDWIKLGLKEDLSGLGGRILRVTPEELEKHNTEEDAWICVKGESCELVDEA